MASDSITDVGRRMRSLLIRKGFHDPRAMRGTVSWILENQGWFTITWVTVTNYAGDPKLVRFRNDVHGELPKTQWRFKAPDVFRFELTAHASEMTHDALAEIIDYSGVARTAARSEFDRHPPRFAWGGEHGNYGWTEQAWNYARSRDY